MSTMRFALPNGTLTVKAEPWARVTIDDKPTGTTPLENLRLPIGRHTVVFSNPEFGERHVEVSVRAGTPTLLSIDLRR